MSTVHRRINPLLFALLGTLGAFWMWQQFGLVAGLLAAALAATGVIVVLVPYRQAVLRCLSRSLRVLTRHRRVLILGWAAITAIVICLFVLEVRRAQRQQKIVTRLEQIGARVTYDYQIGAEGEPVPMAQHPAPEVIRRILGLGIFAHAVEIDFPTRVPDDDEVAAVRDLRELKRLYLGGARVTDSCVVHLETLTGLEELHIVGTQISTSGVKRLQQKLPGCKIFQ